MVIVESAFASVVLSEGVRYAREQYADTKQIERAIENAAEQTAQVDPELDEADIFAVLDTEEVEKIVDEAINQGEVVDDKQLLQAVNEDIISDLDVQEILETFVANIQLEIAKQDALGHVLNLTYSMRVLDYSETILNRVEDVQSTVINIRKEIKSGNPQFDILSDLNIPKRLDWKLAQLGIRVKSAADPKLMNEADLMAYAITNDVVLLSCHTEFVKGLTPTALERNDLELDPVVRQELLDLLKDDNLRVKMIPWPHLPKNWDLGIHTQPNLIGKRESIEDILSRLDDGSNTLD